MILINFGQSISVVVSSRDASIALQYSLEIFVVRRRCCSVLSTHKVFFISAILAESRVVVIDATLWVSVV